MSNIVINNRMISDQKIRTVDIQKVNLPFNVSKEQVSKLTNLLSKVRISLEQGINSLDIKDMNFGGISIKPQKPIENSRFTLKSTYVATIKSNIIEKVTIFYNKIKPQPENKIPVFNIAGETNLQQALREATAEIPLEEINKSLFPNDINKTTNPNMPVQPLTNNINEVNNSVLPNINTTEKQNVVLANSPYETNDIKMNSNILPNNNINQMQFVTNGVPNNQNMMPEQQNIKTNENNMINQNIPNNINPMMPQQLDNQVPQPMPLPETEIQNSKVKVKKLSGKVFTIPIVIIWLGLVLVGSIKLVTSILT